MKKSILTILLALFATMQTFAHFLWIETSPTGKINREQEIRVYFGEYNYDVIEKVDGEAFPKVKDFTLWVVDPSGTKTELKTTAFEEYYSTKFTPTKKGTYTVLLNNNKIDVVDYTQYDFGIFKTHYHSVTKIQVGGKNQDTVASNNEGITVKHVSDSPKEVKLQVLYKNKPLAKNEVKVFISDLWSKTLHTDDNGFVSFKLPWKTKYIIETTIKEEVPGKYKGEDYQFIWHCVTYSINQ
ncbi:putative GH25 family protein [Tenacibaculum adriaticum]|uniref:Putative GH25 family protein n=1 Tax=Tenacibaculum adriaticum TaxID=413713 RepID=A0A5S5DQZ3_9FLAO|nr:DUF4198 domain-containing protein [Tenacibaculum adriaticum]TYP98145.1 putative GH25 family protein [Tenacibaculum adriaticum]